MGLRSGSSRPGRGYKLEPCSLSCLHLALMPELAAPSKAGKGELVKGKCLPFAPLSRAISSTRKEFWCQVFIPKPHSDNGVFRSHSNLLLIGFPSRFQNSSCFQPRTSHALRSLSPSLLSPTFQTMAEAHFLSSPPHPWYFLTTFGISLISLSLVEEAVQVQRWGSHSWVVADATHISATETLSHQNLAVSPEPLQFVIPVLHHSPQMCSHHLGTFSGSFVASLKHWEFSPGGNFSKLNTESGFCCSRLTYSGVSGYLVLLGVTENLLHLLQGNKTIPE